MIRCDNCGDIIDVENKEIVVRNSKTYCSENCREEDDNSMSIPV